MKLEEIKKRVKSTAEAVSETARIVMEQAGEAVSETARVMEGMVEQAGEAVSEKARTVVEQTGELTEGQFERQIDRLLNLMEIAARQAAKRNETIKDFTVSAQINLVVGSIGMNVNFNTKALQPAPQPPIVDAAIDPSPSPEKE